MQSTANKTQNTAKFSHRILSQQSSGISYLLSSPVLLEHFTHLSSDKPQEHSNAYPVVHTYGDYYFALHGSLKFWSKTDWRQRFFYSPRFKEMVTSFEAAVNDINQEKFSFPFIMNSMTIDKWSQIQNARYRTSSAAKHLDATQRKYLDTALYIESENPYIYLEDGGFHHYRIATGWGKPASLVGAVGTNLVFH